MTAIPEMSILLVDDDDHIRRVVEYQLTQAGFEVSCASSGEQALEVLHEKPNQLVISDLVMPGIDGLQLLERLQILHPGVLAIMITAHGEVGRAVRAMQLGAIDFVEKPFTTERLLVAVRKAGEFIGLRDENRRLRARIQEQTSFSNIVGSSDALKKLLEQVNLAADTDAAVLIEGESGTGKELVARALHLNSRRREAPFIVVNCGAIPEHLIEAELFGYRRGAFTGADRDKPGKFEAAAGGTVFLDEVGELPQAVQPKLLRVLQEGEVDKIGASSPLPVDVRIVAATHRDLGKMTRAGEFRDDLWYRLNVVPLRAPPLRERQGDIPLLVAHFLAKHSRRHGRPVPDLDRGVFQRFEKYDWPGNVRELENIIERLVVLSTSGVITPADLPENVGSGGPRYGGLRLDLPPGGIVLEEVERGLVEESLRRASGNRSRAARFLGISRQTLLYRMRKFGLR